MTDNQQSIAEDFANEVRREMDEKLATGSKCITSDDAARVQSAESQALSHRPLPGSTTTQTQSTGDKVEIIDAAQKKLDADPVSVTADDAKKAVSAEHKVLGHLPPKDSISATMQRTAAANEHSVEEDTPIKAPPPVARGRRQSIAAAEQSHKDREKNYEAAAQDMKEKLEHHPEDITKDDAKHMRRLDIRAHGGTEKGSLTAQVQSEAAKHENGAKQGNGAKQDESKTGTPAQGTKASGGVEPSAPAALTAKATSAEETDAVVDGAGGGDGA